MQHRSQTQYDIGRLATLKNELKNIIKSFHLGKTSRKEAADRIIELRDEIDKIIDALNCIEHVK